MKSAIFSSFLVCSFVTASFTLANAETRKLNNPTYKGLALDWSYDWGEIGCGKRVADAFCKTKKFKRSVGYKKREDPGGRTRQISNDSICDANYCDSFRFIMCER